MNNPIDKYSDIRLSENFSVGEFYVSSSHPELARKSAPFHADIFALKLLCIEILQKIRDEFGPIKVLSGYRSRELNDAIGGSKDSDHLYGTAADIVPLSFDIGHVFSWLVLDSDIPYRQAILYPIEGFVHISNNLPTREVKHQAFIKDKGDKYLTYERFIKEIENKGEKS